MFSSIEAFVIKKFGKCEGIDQFGNSYYSMDGKRFAVYAKNNDTSSVPANWHCWLHYLSEKPLNIVSQHLPNKTGTKESYKPNPSGVRNKVSSDYTPWIPQNDNL